MTRHPDAQTLGNPDAYYEAQYNNRLAIPDAAIFNARGVERSAAARNRLAKRLDLPYGPSARQRIDLYPAAAERAPILSFIHGGYWRSRDKSEFAFIAEPFVAAGITVAMPEYDLAPTVTVAAIVEQMVAAHAWLYRNAAGHGADPSRLFVAGHSAGGHLAAMMAATHWKDIDAALPPDLVKGAYAVSGLFDLMPMLHFSFNADIGLDAASAKAMSPIEHAPAWPVPVRTAAGALESDEFRRQCQVLAERWPASVKGHMDVPGCHHLSVAEALADPQGELFRSVRNFVLGEG
jgi:arylformamidase